MMEDIKINPIKLVELDLGNNLRSIVITDEEGYKPMMECRDILISKLGFILLKEYGLTDMTYELSYGGRQYSLKYLSLDDLISFDTVIYDEDQLKMFRMAANYIINEREKKRVDDKTKK